MVPNTTVDIRVPGIIGVNLRSSSEVDLGLGYG